MGRVLVPFLALAGCAVVAACGSSTSPSSRTATGYLMTVTPSSSCSSGFLIGAHAVVKYSGELSGWHSFRGLRTIGTPRDPTLEVKLRNLGSGVVEGSVYAGASAFAGSPSFYFRMPGNPSFPVVVPITGTGDVLTADVSAVLNGTIFTGTSSCTASDHRLQFARVFDALE